MSFDVVNPWMLAAIAGIALPMIAHLLSRHKHDVVPWAAMQFLDPDTRTRRNLRLEELLLLLLRITLIGLLVLIFARPRATGGPFSRFVSARNRDVVLIIDGSFSMDYRPRTPTAFEAAVQSAYEIVESLRPGDTLAMLDARDGVRRVIDPPTLDQTRVRQTLGELPSPCGTSDLADACHIAAGILNRTDNPRREIIVLTDGQAVGWTAGDTARWRQFDEHMSESATPPKTFVVDVTRGNIVESNDNVSVHRIGLERELTVANFPVRISAKLSRSGGVEPLEQQVSLEINGQRLSDDTQTVTLPPAGESSVEFEYRFAATGSHLVSIVTDGDNLPGDDRAYAAIEVTEALQVLLVEDGWHANATRRDTFFARAALTSADNDTPWIRASVIRTHELVYDRMAGTAAIILANVREFTPDQAHVLRDFVRRGGGLLFAAGDNVNREAWNEMLFENGQGLLPASLLSIQTTSAADDSDGVMVADTSLYLPFVARFRTENGGALADSHFTNWWRTVPATARSGKLPNTRTETVAPATVAARLTSGDALLVTRRYGRGAVMLMTVPLDADWSTLPAKPDFVALLHEIVFNLSSSTSTHNVDPGMPLLAPLPEHAKVEEFTVFGPGQTRFEAAPAGDDLRPMLALSETQLAGVYTLRRSHGDERHFVVNFDRAESDLTRLTEEQIATLSAGRMTFVSSLDELRQQQLDSESPTELWPVGMLLFLAMLLGELALTRRMVRRGHSRS